LTRPAAGLLPGFLRCRSHAVTMAAQVKGLASPLAVFLPYRLNGFSDYKFSVLAFIAG